MRITAIEPFVCDGGLREFGFLKVTTDEGIVGWAETYDWHTSASLATALHGDGPAAHRRGPAPDRAHERADLVRRPAGRPGADEGPRRASTSRSGTSRRSGWACRCTSCIGGMFRDRIPLYWSHFATYRAVWPEVLGAEPQTRPTRIGRRAPATSSPRASRSSRRTSSQEARARRQARGLPHVPRRRDRQAHARRGRDAGSARSATSSGRRSASPSTSSSTTGWAASCSSRGRWSRSTCTGWRSRASTPTRCSRRASRPRPGCATARASSGARQFRPFFQNHVTDIVMIETLANGLSGDAPHRRDGRAVRHDGLARTTG